MPATCFAQMDAQESSRLYTPLMAAASRASMQEGKGDTEEAEGFLQCVALLVASGAGDLIESDILPCTSS